VCSTLVPGLTHPLPAPPRRQASELFPTEMRGVAHGFSAAVGKLGALTADIVLGQARALAGPVAFHTSLRIAHMSAPLSNSEKLNAAVSLPSHCDACLPSAWLGDGRGKFAWVTPVLLCYNISNHVLQHPSEARRVCITRVTRALACGRQVDDRMKFYLSAAAGGMGVLVTMLWVPELSTLDLAEGDARWAALRKGARPGPPAQSRACRHSQTLLSSAQLHRCSVRMGVIGYVWDLRADLGLDHWSEAGGAPTRGSKGGKYSSATRVRRPHADQPGMNQRRRVRPGLHLGAGAHSALPGCRAGDPDSYNGEAVNPQNLSFWERMIGIGKLYKAAPGRQSTAENGTALGQSTAKSGNA